jgi:hypothetical protein
MGPTTINQKASEIVAEMVVMVAVAHAEMVAAVVTKAEAVVWQWEQEQRWQRRQKCLR